MDSIEKLRAVTKKKLIVMILSTLLPLVIVVVMSICNFEISEQSIFALYAFLPIILFILFEAYIAAKIVKYIRILRNDEYCNKIIIKKNDERSKFIAMKSYALVDKIFIYVIGLACIFTAFVEKEIFYMCFAVNVAFVLIHVAVRIYYHKKY